MRKEDVRSAKSMPVICMVVVATLAFWYGSWSIIICYSS